MEVALLDCNLNFRDLIGRKWIGNIILVTLEALIPSSQTKNNSDTYHKYYM